MATSGILGSCERFNNNKTETICFQSARIIGFQQQTNKLYMVGVSAPKISVNRVLALNE
jgi:hypothetical protein